MARNKTTSNWPPQPAENEPPTKPTDRYYMGKRVTTVISLLLLAIGIYFCLSGEYAVSPRRRSGTITIVGGPEVIFLALLIFFGYRYALYQRRK